VAKERSSELTHGALMSRKSWTALPAIAALHGDADFFKREIQARFASELEKSGGPPAIRRFTPAETGPAGPPLAEVLDELRTPSFLGSKRLVIVEGAGEFLEAHREALEPFIASGFSGGHLILTLDSLDLRTRFARLLGEKGWVIACKKPFDRPPPWKPDADPWENDLCLWVAARARQKKVALAPELAHAFAERVGSDLGTLDEELEKLRSYLESTGKPADLESIEAVAGELREDSIFDLVDAFLAADRAGALRTAERLHRLGYHPQKGTPVLDPSAIWSLFVGALIVRLRALRRAHALQAEGQGPDRWVALRLTPKPFLVRFQRDLRATSPARIRRAFAALRELDRAVKSGARPQDCLEMLLLGS
jgi:DNA polymerase III delta subunit